MTHRTTILRMAIVMLAVASGSFLLGATAEAFDHDGIHWPLGVEETKVCYFLTDGTIGSGYKNGITAADDDWTDAHDDFRFQYRAKGDCQWTRAPGSTIKKGGSYWNWKSSRHGALGSGDMMVTLCHKFIDGLSTDTLIARCIVAINHTGLDWVTTSSGNEPSCFDNSNKVPRADIESIAIHEFGHWLELLHSGVSTAVMVDGFDTCTSSGKVRLRQSLTGDDINGINDLY